MTSSSSSSALSELRTGPLYFFDQPTRPNRVKETWSHVLHFNAHETSQSNEEAERAGSRSDLKPDPPRPIKDPEDPEDPMGAYRRAAPRVLDELARLLSDHRWPERGCVPRGVANILDWSWRDLTSGLAAQLNRTHNKRRGSVKSAGSPRQVSAVETEETGEAREAGERSSGVPGGVERKQASLNPRTKRRKQNATRALGSSTISFSISSSGCGHPGWIIQPRQPACDEPQRISLCQWAVERLQAARNPEKLQTAGQDLSKPLVLCHYGEAKVKVTDRTGRRKAPPPALVDGMPRIPEVKQLDPARRKLHYRIDDGSSFVYPSGCVAVCQSHSALPRGGFYTNVFSDGERPVVLATVTAFGRGAVSDPLSSSVTAVWDQDGGFTADDGGNVTKEWSWQGERPSRDRIVLRVSDLICVTLLSGTSASLSFRCGEESVQLPLCALSHVHQPQEAPCLQTDVKFRSDAAQDLLLARKTRPPAAVPEGKRSLTLTPVSARSRDVLQMAREVEVEGPREAEEPSARWRRAGPAGRELKRLQQRVRNTLEDWLDYYRAAVGVRCPEAGRLPDAPLRAGPRRRREELLPSLNPPGRPDVTDVAPARPEEPEPPAHLSASPVRPPRTTKRRVREEPRVTQIGPLQIHGNIKPESVIIPQMISGCRPAPRLPGSQAPPALLPPSVPLTVCPALLRAALLGEGGRRRCGCSAARMPVVTDLEFDTFVMGQPPHSQQILVVCVTPPPAKDHQDRDRDRDQDVLEQLYRRRNRHRTTPCTQCQMDSFRLVRYEMSAGRSRRGLEEEEEEEEEQEGEEENVLLRRRHNAAPGMVLMYIRGKLLFVGDPFGGGGLSVRDLQRQICRTRGDHRSGRSLPPDYRVSVEKPQQNSHDASVRGGGGDERPADRKKTSERKHTKVHQRLVCPKPQKTPSFPRVSALTC